MSRKQEFLETGAKLAVKVGVVNVTRRAIAAHHKVTDPLVSKYVGGKAEMRKAIKSTMKKLGLVEPAADVAEAKGKALRARKGTAPAKKAVKKAATKKAATKKAAPAKKSVAKKGNTAVGATKPASASTTPKKRSVAKKLAGVGDNHVVVRLATGADPKKGAPSNKAKKFKPKEAPPLPPLPELLTPTI
jgi:hypothetical protein